MSGLGSRAAAGVEDFLRPCVGVKEKRLRVATAGGKGR